MALNCWPIRTSPLARRPGAPRRASRDTRQDLLQTGSSRRGYPNPARQERAKKALELANQLAANRCPPRATRHRISPLSFAPKARREGRATGVGPKPFAPVGTPPARARFPVHPPVPLRSFHRPEDPNPPAPRLLSPRSEVSSNSTASYFAITICAMRSPFFTT